MINFILFFFSIFRIFIEVCRICDSLYENCIIFKNPNDVSSIFRRHAKKIDVYAFYLLYTIWYHTILYLNTLYSCSNFQVKFKRYLLLFFAALLMSVQNKIHQKNSAIFWNFVLQKKFGMEIFVEFLKLHPIPWIQADQKSLPFPIYTILYSL